VSLDTRNYSEIMTAHPGPWNVNSTGRLHAGTAELQVTDAKLVVVPLFTVLKVAFIAATAAAHAKAPS
jgi:hypothetical protein